MRIPTSEERFKEWVNNIPFDEQPAGGLEYIEDAYYRDLAFGTGGLRGLLGMGPNRMNVYTVAKATQGLANYLNAEFSEPRVVIARDSRTMGREFVEMAASVFAANGIKALVFPKVEPTPLLSYAVRELGCSAGVNITASHNPAEFNGYKVYRSDGCQITTEMAKEIQEAINEVDIFADIKITDFSEAVDQGIVEWVEDEVLESYIHDVISLGNTFDGDKADLSLAFSPLNGAGLECVQKMFGGIGLSRFYVVPEQAEPDGNFLSCPYPNPEIKDAFELGMELGKATDSEIILVTDPDADRVGVMARHGDDYALLTGNEIGILLLDWLCRMLIDAGASLEGRIVITTIVSSAMAEVLANEYGLELRKTLTGFKFIGEQIGMLEQEGELNRFLFGFEESCGYLAGTFVRDKDAVIASMLVCKMASWYRQQGQDLVAAMDALYRKYGFFRNALISVDYSGVEGAQKIQQIMKELRSDTPGEIAGCRICEIVDYSENIQMPVWNAHDTHELQILSKSNVLEFRLEGENRVIIRPSGTEPKIKAYVFSQAKSAALAEELLKALKQDTRRLLS